MPSHNTYCLTWVSLTLDVGYLLTATPPDLELGSSVSRSSRGLEARLYLWL